MIIRIPPGIRIPDEDEDEPCMEGDDESYTEGDEDPGMDPYDYDEPDELGDA